MLPKRLITIAVFFFIALSNIHTQVLSTGFSTFIGGSSEDRAHGMAVDEQGNIYLTAPIQSTDFPITGNALQPNTTGVYLAKINAAGDSLLYSTFIGAPGGANYAHGIAVDNEGCIYIAGNTTNQNFPTSENAFDQSFNGPSNASHGDAFVMKLNPAGTEIIYSTFIGGNGMDLCGKIIVDEEGCAYVIGTTSSTDFPVTEGAFDTTFNGGEGDGRDDIFVIKLNADGSNLIYSTYIGGSTTELHGDNIVVDQLGSVYFAATTASLNFPTTTNTYDNSYNGGSGNHGAGDGVVVKINAEGTDLEYSTFIGGAGDDFAKWLTLDDEGNIYVCGSADTSGFPITSNISNNPNTTIGYFAKFDPTLSQLIYSKACDSGIKYTAIQKSGNIIITGTSESNNLPVTQDALYTSNKGSGDIFIHVVNPVTDEILYGTYFGGSNNDAISSMLLGSNSLYISGNTASTDFPVSQNAYDDSFNGGTNHWGGDAFVTKFNLIDITSSTERTGSILQKQFHLNQNYPNPFNPNTNISYTLSEPGKVRLAIFDSLGQLVNILVNNYQSVGEYSVVWNGKSNLNDALSSGVYFYSLTINDKTLHKKMILLR